MGFKKHCGNSQALVWGSLLRQMPEDFALEGDGKLGVPDSVFSLKFHRAGRRWFIVLVYDSILIATTQPTAWEKRIRRNFGNEEGTNLHLKYLTVEETVAVFGYCGLEIAQNGQGARWRADPEGVKTWKESVLRPMMMSTPRSVFRLLGFLRFVAPILNWPRRTGRCEEKI